MSGRRITIELTERQYNELCAAVALHACVLEDDDEDYASLRSLNQAWTKINRAWHNTTPKEN